MHPHECTATYIIYACHNKAGISGIIPPLLRHPRENYYCSREKGLSQTFLEYGLWQDFGTGKEIPRGNHGDIGREKGGNRDVDNIAGGNQRKPKKWFSRKYYASVMNIREFLADNLGNEFVGIVAKSLDDNYRRYNH